MQENKGNYLTGIIGALIGGLIGAIPWIMAYVFLNMILSIAAVFIALCAYAGYKKFNGPKNKGAVWIIVLVSLVVVTIANFVIIPIFYLAKDGFAINMTYYKWFFSSSDLVAAMVKDYLFSILFAVLGIQGVARSIKDEVSTQEDYPRKNTEPLAKIKHIFSKYNALDRENAIPKEAVLNELDAANPKSIFQTYCSQRIIRKYKGNYYFDERAETDSSYRLKQIVIYTLKVFLIVFAVTFALTMLAVIIGLML